MVRPVPVLYIDTIEQLAQRTDIHVVVRRDGSFDKYIHSNQNSVSKNIADKLIDFVNFEDIRHLVMSGLRNGSIAFIYPQIALKYHLQELSKFQELEHIYSDRLIDLVHISRSIASEPYFLFINETTSHKSLFNNLNTM